MRRGAGREVVFLSVGGWRAVMRANGVGGIGSAEIEVARGLGGNIDGLDLFLRWDGLGNGFGDSK